MMNPTARGAGVGAVSRLGERRNYLLYLYVKAMKSGLSVPDTWRGLVNRLELAFSGHWVA